MSDEGERLYKIYSSDYLTKGLGAPDADRCRCDFHQGNWNARTTTTSARAKVPNVKLTGNGCLASGANPPPLQGLPAWMPQPTGGTMFGLTRRTEQDIADDERGKIERIKAYKTPKTGYNCIRCNFKNDYASSNRSDGSYLCFNCR